MMYGYVILGAAIGVVGLLLVLFAGPVKKWADSQPSSSGLKTVGGYRLMGLGCIVVGALAACYALL